MTADWYFALAHAAERRGDLVRAAHFRQLAMRALQQG